MQRRGFWPILRPLIGPLIIPLSIGLLQAFLRSPQGAQAREYVKQRFIEFQNSAQFERIIRDLPPEFRHHFQNIDKQKFWDEFFRSMNQNQHWQQFQREFNFDQQARQRQQQQAPKRNLYDVLGVSRSASQAEMKVAFSQKVKKYHPDRMQNAPAAERKKASEKFQEVMGAFEVLRDPKKRRTYDLTGRM